MDGKRVRQVFPTLQKAKDVAAEKASQMTTGDLGAAKLTDADSAAYRRAEALLEPVGAALEFAASEYASAVKRLVAVSLSQAVDFHLKRHPVHMEPKMVRAVVDELLKLKESEQLSVRYRKQLAYDLNRFAGRFCGRLRHVAGTDVDEWLRDLKVGPRARNNLRNSVQSLFNFAISRRYLPTDHDELSAVPLARDGGGEIEIYSPQEMADLLAVASPEHVPFLAIGAFAGLRHAELQRLDWAEVRIDDGFIEVKPNKAKTASRRLVPIQDNLKRWLKPYRKASGHICDYVNTFNQIDKLAVIVDAKLKEKDSPAAFAWKRNALRHSCISYRVAAVQNVAQVALEAGNSPQMIFRHYRELVRPADAAKWFAIGPLGPVGG